MILLKSLYEQNVFGDGSGFLVTLLIDSRPSEFLADSLLPHFSGGDFLLTFDILKDYPEVHPEVLDTFYILKWYE